MSILRAISASGSLNMGLTPGTYGGTNSIPVITVNASGNISVISRATPSISWSEITSTPTTIAGYGITDAVSNTTTVTGGTSLTGGGALSSNQVLTLVNDSTTPGNSFYYGTNSSGTKGYFTLPAAGSGTVNAGTAQQLAFYATSTAAVSGTTLLTLGAGSQVTITSGGLAVTGNTSVASGTATFSGGAFTVSPASANVVLSPTGTGVVTINPATLSTMDNMTIGATTKAAASVTTLIATGAVTLSPANLAVTINPTGSGTVTISPVGALTINPTAASTINNTSIGVTTAAAGRFTTLTSTAAVTLSPASANVVLSPTGTGVVTISPATSGTMDNIAIGNTTKLSGKFTTLLANTTITAGLATVGTGIVNIAGTTSGTVSLTVAAAAGTYTMTFPTANAAGVFTNDGSGNITFTTAGLTAGQDPYNFVTLI